MQRAQTELEQRLEQAIRGGEYSPFMLKDLALLRALVMELQQLLAAAHGAKQRFVALSQERFLSITDCHRRIQLELYQVVDQTPRSVFGEVTRWDVTNIALDPQCPLSLIQAAPVSIILVNDNEATIKLPRSSLLQLRDMPRIFPLVQARFNRECDSQASYAEEFPRLENDLLLLQSHQEEARLYASRLPGSEEVLNEIAAALGEEKEERENCSVWLDNTVAQMAYVAREYDLCLQAYRRELAQKAVENPGIETIF